MSRFLRAGLFRFVVLGLFISLAIAVLAFSAQEKSKPVDTVAYEDMMAAQVSDVYDLGAFFEEARDLFLIIVPPDPAFILQQPCGPILPFPWKSFPPEFVKNLVPEYENSVPVYRIVIMEDPISRETVFATLDGTRLFSLPPATGYDPFAYVQELFPALYSGKYSAERVDYLKRLYDPIRVRIIAQLIPSEYVEPYLYVESRLALEQAKANLPSQRNGLLRSPESASNIVLEALLKTTNGLRISIGYPDAFTNRLEIFTCTNLLAFQWALSATNLSTMGTNSISYFDTSAYGVNAATSPVYAVGNADLESDGDGLKDAHEFFIYHTRMDSLDSDGDGLVDGFSGVVGTNAYPGGISTNGAYVIGELSIGTTAYMADTDGDGLSDGAEVKIRTDPLNPDDPPSVSGIISYAGRQTGSIWVVAVTNATGWSTNKGVKISTPGSYQIPNVRQTNYYIKAWRDSNRNNLTNVTEAWGSLAGNPLVVTNKVTGKNITLSDPDYDADTLPDWWEVRYFVNTAAWGATNDPDADSYSNAEEYSADTNPTNKNSHPANIEGTVFYGGPQTGTIYVIAVTSAASWTAVGSSSLSTTGSYAITHLPTNCAYWVKAYRDSNNNAAREFFEASGVSVSNPVFLLTNTAGIHLTLADSDADGDGLPDYWEVQQGMDPFSGGQDGLSAWWKMDGNGSTTLVFDASASANHGVLLGSVGSWRFGVLSNALSFNGSDNYVAVPDSASLKPNSISLAFWVRPDRMYSLGTNAVFISKREGPYGYEVSYENGGLQFFIGDTGSNIASFICTLSSGVWYHVAATYDSCRQEIYLNGALQAVSAWNCGMSFGEIDQATNALRMGAASGAAPSLFYRGRLDDVRVFNSALPSNSVYGIYELGLDADADGLGAWEEYHRNTDPSEWDTDKDFYADGYECLNGKSPTNAASHPPYSVLINEGAVLTTNSTLTLALTNEFMWADQVVVADNEDFVGEVTYPFARLMEYTLPDNSNGFRDVYLYLRHTNGIRNTFFMGRVLLDTEPPSLSEVSPADDSVTNRLHVDITGLATDNLGAVRVLVNSNWVDGISSGRFYMARHLLQPGTNALTIEVSDQAGHAVSTQIIVTVETTGDTNAPQAQLDLPMDYEITGDQTNFYNRTTYADSEDLYVRGHADADAEWVWLYAENGDGATNSRTAMGRLGTQLLGRVELFPGSNWVCVAAEDAAGNVSTSRYAVIRDTNYVFKIIDPAPYAELTGSNIVVKGEISGNLTGAVVIVNGVGIQIGALTNGVWTFQTTQAVAMAIGLNHIEGAANVNGRSLYVDPPTGYQMLSFHYKWQYKAYSENLNQRIWQNSVGTADWTAPLATWFRHLQTQSRTCTSFPDYHLAGCSDTATVDYASFPLPAYSWSPWVHFGYSDQEQTASRATTLYWDTEIRFIKHSESDEEQLVLLKFEPLLLGNEANFSDALLPQIFFRGSPAIRIGGNGLVGFVTKIKPNIEQRITASDFQWPSHPDLLWKGSLLSIGQVSNAALRSRIIPDWNHDRAIDPADEEQATALNPFRFWINDDNDSGDIADGDSDVPGQDDANCDDTEVNGRCDLLDFFPVFLDIHQFLNALPLSAPIQVKLKQADSAVKMVYTDLTRDHAGDYLTTETNTYGPSFNQPAHQAQTITVGPSGIDLNVSFLARIRSTAGKGVLLFEGIKATNSPLVMEISLHGFKVFEQSMPLSIDGVEKMYRWVNLRGVAGGSVDRATDTSPPTNYPDSLCNGKNYIFVHGFNSPESGARAWNSEVFKRLYQSGSRAMYTAVTWEGDETPGILKAGAYYHADVINAFQTASNLTAIIGALPGQKYLAAHSLGNMVASSAIVDHGLNPVRYFMIDAAVAMEAYIPSFQYPEEIAVSPWASYSNRLWSSEWYRLFDPSDGRYNLSWRDRFGDIPQAINYYSLGEDVLQNNDPPEEMYLPGTAKAWVFQEKVKGGILPVILVGVDSHGGWGFNGTHYFWVRYPEDTDGITEEELRLHSFFKPFYLSDLYGTNGSIVAADAQVRAKILAEAIPSTSRAAGRNELAGFGLNGGLDGNIDLMTTKTGWPAERLAEDDEGPWFHSDFKNVAFPYVHLFFEDMVSKGGMQ